MKHFLPFFTIALACCLTCSLNAIEIDTSLPLPCQVAQFVTNFTDTLPANTTFKMEYRMKNSLSTAAVIQATFSNSTQSNARTVIKKMLDVLLTTQDYDIAIYPLSAFGETGIFFSNTRKVANLNACDSDLLTSTTSKQPGVSGDMYRIVGGEVVATVITINGADEDSQPLPLPAGFTNNNYSGSWSGKTDNSAVLQLPIFAPNPFADFTQCSYQLAADAQVSLSIYDLQGNKVAQPLEQVSQYAGEQTVPIHAENLPKGIYFYRLIINQQVKTGKIIKL